MFSFTLSTTFSVTEIPPIREEILLISIFKCFSKLKVLQFFILKERFKAFLKVFFSEVDRETLPSHPQDILFEHIFLNASL